MTELIIGGLSVILGALTLYIKSINKTLCNDFYHMFINIDNKLNQIIIILSRLEERTKDGN